MRRKPRDQRRNYKTRGGAGNKEQFFDFASGIARLALALQYPRLATEIPALDDPQPGDFAMELQQMEAAALGNCPERLYRGRLDRRGGVGHHDR